MKTTQVRISNTNIFHNADGTFTVYQVQVLETVEDGQVIAVMPHSAVQIEGPMLQEALNSINASLVTPVPTDGVPEPKPSLTSKLKGLFGLAS